jgi:hypothetical protein
MDHLGKNVSISCGSKNSRGLFDDFTGIGSRTNKKKLSIKDLEIELEVEEVMCETVVNVDSDNLLLEYESKPKDGKSSEILTSLERGTLNSYIDIFFKVSIYEKIAKTIRL